MQTTNDLYKELLDNETCSKEYRAVIAGETYEMGRIISATISGGIFEKDTVCIGSAVSRELDLVLINPGVIPKGAKIQMYYRLSARVPVEINDQPGYMTSVSDWMPKGVFFIDTRSTDVTTGVMTIHAYDCIMRAEQEWTPDQSLEFPLAMNKAAEAIAKVLGTTLDARCEWPREFKIDYPFGYTCRDILRFIAIAYGGNWTVTEDGKLRLLRLNSLLPETGYLVKENGAVIVFGGIALKVDDFVNATGTGGKTDQTFVGPKVQEVKTCQPLDKVTGVFLQKQDESGSGEGDVGFGAGNRDGLELQAATPYATQAMADGVLADLKGYAYQPLQAQSALIDPAVELGDAVDIAGCHVMLADMTVEFTGLMAADIGSPGEREIESEIGVTYIGRTAQEVNRQLSTTRSTITKTAEEITLRIDQMNEDLDGAINQKYSEIKQTVDSITTRVGEISQEFGEKYSQLQQTVDSITLEVTNGEESSTIQLMKDGVAVSSKNIEMTGLVTIKGLEGGTTTISGDCIKTGKIDAEYLSLTGKITFSDLDSGAQGTINGKLTSDDLDGYATTDWVEKKGYRTESQVGTQITGALVNSPNIQGGRFWNADTTGSLMMQTAAGSGRSVPSFSVYSDTYSEVTPHYVLIYVASNGDLTYGGKRYNGPFTAHFGPSVFMLTRPNGTTIPLGTWDFSNASVILGSNVSGLPSTKATWSV